MNRPRAADDFSAIRSRMEELRRERAQVVAGDDPREVPVPRDHSEAGKPTVAVEPRLPRRPAPFVTIKPRAHFPVPR
jgi:hypothetical protein